MPTEPRKVVPGQRSTARIWNRMVDAVRSLRLPPDGSSGGISEQTPAGTAVRGPEEDEFPVRITAGPDGSGRYAWVRVVAAPGGLWTEVPAIVGSATFDPAREQNDQVASVPQVVWLRREPYSRDLIFDRDTCG